MPGTGQACRRERKAGYVCAAPPSVLALQGVCRHDIYTARLRGRHAEEMEQYACVSRHAPPSVRALQVDMPHSASVSSTRGVQYSSAAAKPR
jgi:hypothetical protein